MGRKKNPTTVELLERITNGELKSIGQWAEDLFGELTIDTKRAVTQALATLRRNGHMFFAVDQGGPIEDVSGNATKFNHVFNRYVGSHVEPQLVRSFEYAERLVQEHPKLKEDVVKRAKLLLQTAAASNKALLGIGYEPARKDSSK